jgi:hypothetical protein
MIIKCIENKRSSLPLNKRDGVPDTDYIRIGKEYVVYGLCQFSDDIEFLVYEGSICSYPIWCLSLFFEITNPLVSRYWLGSIKNTDKGQKGVAFGFPELINDYTFYDNLTDGEEEEVQIFRYYRTLMELEFPNNSIKEKAQIGDEKWLMCPSCIDAWEDSDSRNAMVICPMCKQMFHSPRYRSPNERKKNKFFQKHS